VYTLKKFTEGVVMKKNTTLRRLETNAEKTVFIFITHDDIAGQRMGTCLLKCEKKFKVLGAAAKY